MHTNLWNPWSIFDERSLAPRSSQWPRFEIEDTDDVTLVTADVPGMSEDDLEVTVTSDTLVVRGARKDGRQHREFERRFQLGRVYDPDRVSASVTHGVLSIRLEKAAQAKPRRIKLTTGGLAAKVKGLFGVDKEKPAAA